MGKQTCGEVSNSSGTPVTPQLGPRSLLYSEPGVPIARERWAGAGDSVGSATPANVLALTQYRGVVTTCGLAQGLDL